MIQQERTSDASTTSKESKSSLSSNVIESENNTEDDLSENEKFISLKYMSHRKLKVDIIKNLNKIVNGGIITCDKFFSLDEYEKLHTVCCGGKDKLSDYHMRLIKGEVIIYEVPSDPHELVSAKLDIIINNYNSFFNDDDVIVGHRSSDCFFQNSRLQPDSKFSNCRIPFQLRPRDLGDNILPNIVVEVGRTESYRSIFSLPEIYFTYDQIRVVLIINLVETPVSQMFMSVYRQSSPDKLRATSVVSFGTRLCANTEEAILTHSRAYPENFRGYGRHQFNTPCNALGLEDYVVRIPANDVWYGVPIDLQPDVIHDLVIDLYRIRQILVTEGLATNY